MCAYDGAADPYGFATCYVVSDEMRYDKRGKQGAPSPVAPSDAINEPRDGREHENSGYRMREKIVPVTNWCQVPYRVCQIRQKRSTNE